MGAGMFIPLLLLIGLGIGSFALRRTLLPARETKLPPSGARPWSRIRIPNPASLGGHVTVTGNMGSFIPMPQINASTVAAASGPLPAPPAPQGLMSTSASPSSSSNKQATSTQTRPLHNSARYWKLPEGEQPSLPSDNLSVPVQGGLLTDFTRYGKSGADGSYTTGAPELPSEPHTSPAAAPPGWLENSVEGTNEDQSQMNTDPFLATHAFEKGLITNAAYYTKLPEQRLSDSWEYE